MENLMNIEDLRVPPIVGSLRTIFFAKAPRKTRTHSLQLSLQRCRVLLQVFQVPGKAIGDAGAVADGICGQTG